MSERETLARLLAEEAATRLRVDVEAVSVDPVDGMTAGQRVVSGVRLMSQSHDLARLLLRYHDALALDRLAHAISEALDEQAERGGGLNVHDLATAVRAKLMEAEHG